MTNNMEYTKEDIVKRMRAISGNIYSVYTDWVKMCAIAIHNSVNFDSDMENDYLTIVKRYKTNELELFAESFGILQMLIENKFDDYLGSIYMMLETGSKRTGQFFTPYHISQLVASFAEEKRIEGRIIINEPSCGAGANIIAFLEKEYKKGVNYQLEYEVIAQDLDWNCIYMCYIQLSLLGVYGKLMQGDTLSELPKNVLYTPAYYLDRGCVSARSKD